MLKNQTEPIGHYKNLADVKIFKISGLCTLAVTCEHSATRVMTEKFQGFSLEAVQIFHLST